MLSTAVLVLLCIYNAKQAKKSGKKPGPFVLLTIGLWLVAEGIGIVVGSLLAETTDNDFLYLVLFFLPEFVFGLLGAGLAVLITKHQKKGKAAPSVTYAFCTNCGKPLSGGAFCKFCGHPIPGAQKEAPIPAQQMPIPEPTYQPPKAKKPRGKGAKIALICAGVCLVLAGVIVGLIKYLPGAATRRAYAAAMEQYNNGQYEEAESAFAELSGFEDATEMKIRASQMQRYTAALELAQSDSDTDLLAAAELFDELNDFMDSRVCAQNCRNEITYCQAAKLQEQEKYEEAAKVFTSVSAYRDAAARAEECRNTTDYARATALYTAGDYEYAMEIFQILGDFRDSAELATECENKVDHDKATQLMMLGEYEEAAGILEDLVNRGVEGADEELEYCRSTGIYNQAAALFEEGKYYEAQKKFLSISSYADAAERAEDCVQKIPSSSELYRNPDYSKKSVTFKVRNNSDEDSVVKMYKNGDLVTMFFIQAGSTATVKIPAGTYTINRGFGTTWYGTEELFGDEGRYYKLNIAGQTEFDFDSGYEYTLGFSGTGSTVGQTSTGRDDC